MKLPKGAKKAGHLALCGVDVPIYLVKDLEDEGQRCFGISIIDEPAILLCTSQGDEHLRQVLVHEAIHTILHLSGAFHEIEQDLSEGVDADRVEERLVRTLTPHITAILNGGKAKPKARKRKASK